jgi:hypothetical protein
VFVQPQALALGVPLAAIGVIVMIGVIGFVTAVVRPFLAIRVQDELSGVLPWLC